MLKKVNNTSYVKLCANNNPKDIATRIDLHISTITHLQMLIQQEEEMLYACFAEEKKLQEIKKVLSNKDIPIERIKN